MTQEDPDLALVQALKIGEDRALNALMDRHREGIFHFVLRHVHNEADALELAMETFARAYFNIEKFRPAAKFATWLHSPRMRDRENPLLIVVHAQSLRQSQMPPACRRCRRCLSPGAWPGSPLGLVHSPQQ